MGERRGRGLPGRQRCPPGGKTPQAAQGGYFFRSCAIKPLVIWIMRSKPPAIEPSV